MIISSPTYISASLSVASEPIHSAPKTDNHEPKLKSFSDINHRLEFGRELLPAADSWSAKGLELSDETLLAATQAFLDGSQEVMTNKLAGKGGGSLSLNAHQIVMNNQDVHQWFLDEYQAQLDVLPPKSRELYESGALFVTGFRDSKVSLALNSYEKISRF
ncbi:MAG: hypothetical protein RPR40_12770 [Bermanella sp.]